MMILRYAHPYSQPNPPSYFPPRMALRRFFVAGAFAMAALLLQPQAGQAADVRYIPPRGAGQPAQIVLRDVIVSGDSARMAQALAQAPAGSRIEVWMDSRGGDVDEGMALGRLFRQYRVSTYHHDCQSSCLYAFLGGVERHSPADGRYILGIHRPSLADAYVAQPSAFGAQMMGMFKDYTVSMLGTSGFYDLMMQVPFANPRPMTHTELASLGVVTVFDR